jgi:hypothetical protein
MKYLRAILVSLAVLPACSTIPPKNPENLCQIFWEKESWYPATLAAARRWGVPISVQMAIIYQESAYVADAEPPRPKLLGIIPWFRFNNAYGYPQAKPDTWSEYQEQSGNWLADRENFDDSCDFVAWYCAVSNKKLGIAPSDTSQLYLAYHEGHNGYRHNSHLAKNWLLNTAQKVSQRALRYDAQLNGCRQKLVNNEGN